MLTCIIRYQIDPVKRAEFAQYARNWGQAIPRCGADLLGYYAPHEGSSTLAYGITTFPALPPMRPIAKGLRQTHWGVRITHLRSASGFCCARTAYF